MPKGARGGGSGPLKAAVVEAKAALAALQQALAETERALAFERGQLEATERRRRLAAEIADPETVAVAERFAARHRDRVSLLERKLLVQRDEVALAGRDLEELAARLHTAGPGVGAAADPPEPDPLLQYRLDRSAHEAAAEAQLAELKRKMGKDQKR